MWFQFKEFLPWDSGISNQKNLVRFALLLERSNAGCALCVVAFDFDTDHFSLVFQNEIHFMISLAPVEEVDGRRAAMVEEVGCNGRLYSSPPLRWI